MSQAKKTFIETGYFDNLTSCQTAPFSEKELNVPLLRLRNDLKTKYGNQVELVYIAPYCSLWPPPPNDYYIKLRPWDNENNKIG